MAVAKLSFDDPAKLSTVDLFRHVGITRQREGEDERLTITMKNPLAKQLKDEGKPGPEIRLVLPGKVLEANRNATIDGNRVAWRFTLPEFFKQSVVDLTARYRVPAAGEPTPGGQPTREDK
jgi:hypothetical protein